MFAPAARAVAAARAATSPASPTTPDRDFRVSAPTHAPPTIFA
jgi:hypothetical protein